MIYSVYNTSSRLFDYYQTNEAATTHAGAPSKSLMASSIGASPEQGAWTLPFGAKKIGSGPIPRGRIAAKGSLLPFAGDGLVAETFGSGTMGVVVAVGAYFIWKHWRK